jgi:hypothetical protein
VIAYKLPVRIVLLGLAVLIQDARTEEQSFETAAIAELEGVGGRDGILRQWLSLRTEPEIGFFTKSLTMLAWFHRNQKPVVSVDTSTVFPAAILASGAIVRTFAVDHLYWTETIASEAGNYSDLDKAGQPREIWLLGTASERCRAELNSLGFDVHEGVAAMLCVDRQ